MPYKKGTAADFNDLLAQLCSWVADSAIHGADAWEVMRSEPWPKGTVFKAHGWNTGDHFYVGLMPTEIIKGETYKNWFLTREVLTSKFAWSPDGLNLKPEKSNITVGPYGITNIEKDDTGKVTSAKSYSFYNPDIFKRSARPMFLGAFKQYSDLMDFCDLGGSPEYLIKPKKIPYYATGNSEPSYFTPPLYPGVGFPAIAMDYEGPRGGLLYWWAIKDRHRIVFAINNGGQWDLAYLGYIDPYHRPNEYPTPLCVIGGTSGAVTFGETQGTGYGYPTQGIGFDYGTKNWQLGRGLPLSAGSPWNSMELWNGEDKFSQVQLMLPDGVWKSFYNWLFEEQTISIDRSYIYAQKKPEQSQNQKYLIRPSNTILSGTKNIYNSDPDDFTYQLEPVELVEGTTDAGVHNFFGRLWRVYWPSGSVSRFGEVTLSGKKHLMVPNIYEGRRWHIPHGETQTIAPDDLLAEELEIMKRTASAQACVIRLED